MKKTGSILILAAVLFLFSCASTPEADSKQTEAVSETTVEETTEAVIEETTVEEKTKKQKIIKHNLNCTNSTRN